MTMKKYVIKEHKVNPFDPFQTDQYLMGYLEYLDHITLAYKHTPHLVCASIMTLQEGALAVAKLNKLNMRFYELCLYENPK